MSQSSHVLDWINTFTDPFAVLGTSVTADDRRVQKRYRQVAMRLHPDRYIDEDEETKELTSKLLARLINPAYEKLRAEKNRKEYLAMLRLKIRRLTRDGPLSPKSELAQKLLQHPVGDVDVFYEQAIAQLADDQFNPVENFAATTEKMLELNLVYLQLKMGDLGVQEKRTGLVAAKEAKPIQFTPAPIHPEIAAETYDQRHYRRAQEYAKKGAWSQAVQELKDAIKIKNDKSEYHSLLGVAYLKLEKPLRGMAKVHLKRALELNPQDRYAQMYGPKLGLTDGKPPVVDRPPSTNTSTNGSQVHQTSKRGGFLELLFGKR